MVFAFQPIINTITKYLSIQSKRLSTVVTIIVYLLMIALLIYLLFLGGVQLYHFVSKLPGYIEQAYQSLQNIHVPESIVGYVDYFYQNIHVFAQNMSTTGLDYVIAFVSQIPSFMFDTMVVIISSLFIIIDYSNIRAMIVEKSNHESYVVSLVDCIKDTISSLFKAYFIIFLVTFIELFCGFYIIGVKEALMLSFVIAFFDFLPVLGLDMILVPWIIVVAFQNQISLALGLLVIYIVVIITKNILEPKLISKQIGVHPLVTLFGMFLGAKILGMIGMIAMPVLIIIIKRIYELNKELTYE